jgi:hypothetical protein
MGIRLNATLYVHCLSYYSHIWFLVCIFKYAALITGIGEYIFRFGIRKVRSLAILATRSVFLNV